MNSVTRTTTDPGKLIIGLTGGIGSGKSAAADAFSRHDITVIDADIVAREVVLPGSQALDRIAERFGPKALLDTGHLDRSYLRQQVFNQESERLWLEKLLHPLINEQITQGLRDSQSHYSVLVSPLLLETPQRHMVGRVLVIDVPRELQISRTVSRDNNSAAQVEKIIAAQMQRDERLRHADDIVNNIGSKNSLWATIDKLHHKYLELADKLTTP